MAILHEADFTRITDLYKFLSENKYRVYCTYNGYQTFRSGVVDTPQIRERLYLNQQSCEFKRPANEPDDSSSGGFEGLRPRVEVVPGVRLPHDVPVHIKYVMTPVAEAQRGTQKFMAYILQIFTHRKSGGGLPVFHISIRNGKISMEYHTINADGSLGPQTNSSVASVVFGQQYEFDVYAVMSEDSSKGRISVYMNKKLVWNKVFKNTGGGDTQIQYGVYGIKGILLNTRVKKIMIETVASFPKAA